MEIYRNGTRPTKPAAADYFTGQVWMDPVNTAPEPARLAAVRVSFAPGARTYWHHHPLGQTLHVLSGSGLIQERGGPLRVLRAGDTAWIPPGIEHWHGAAPDTAMCHLAMQERQDGQTSTWLEEVADGAYSATPTDD